MLYKIIKYLALVLAIIGIIFGAMIMSGNNGQIDNMLYITYAVLVLILGLVIAYVLINMFSSKEAMVNTIKGIGAFLIITLIAYLISDGNATVEDGVETLSASGTKWVNTGLNLFYGLAIIAVGSMAWSGVSKMFK